jgi:hypothetical protein
MASYTVCTHYPSCIMVEAYKPVRRGYDTLTGIPLGYLSTM